MASPPELLNDDRIARALDAVAPQLDAIAGGVGAAAITEFGVDVSRLHWDLTSISLYGAYPEADRGVPGAAVGASEGPQAGSEADPDRAGGQRGRRDPGVPPRLRRRGRGGGPGHRGDDRAEADRRAAPVFAGGRFEADLLHERGGDECPGGGVRRAAGRGPGPGRVVRRAAAGGGHGGGLYRRAGRRQARRRPRQLPGAGRRRDGPARPAQGRPAGASAPDPGVLLGERRRRGQSPRAANSPRPPRTSDRLVRTAGTRFHPTPDAVAARVTAIAAKRRVRAYLRTTITRDAAGKPVLSWHFDQAAIDAEAASRRLVRPADQPGARPGQPRRRSSAATRASTSSNAATASSKAPSRSPPCS